MRLRIFFHVLRKLCDFCLHFTPAQRIRPCTFLHLGMFFLSVWMVLEASFILAFAGLGFFLAHLGRFLPFSLGACWPSRNGLKFAGLGD